MPGSCLVALLCTLSTASICFFLYGDHIHEAYSKWDLTKRLYRGTKFTPYFLAILSGLTSSVRLCGVERCPAQQSEEEEEEEYQLSC